MLVLRGNFLFRAISCDSHEKGKKVSSFRNGSVDLESASVPPLTEPQSFHSLDNIERMTRFLTLLFVATVCTVSNAFTTGAFGTSKVISFRSASALSANVEDVESEAQFDKIVEKAGESLVVIDYSTTWCGPCKVIAPKFDELSEKYPDAVFLKVIGDSSADASKLMKREGVRSVPSFHYIVGGEKVEVVNGANAEAIEAAITKNIS